MNKGLRKEVVGIVNDRTCGSSGERVMFELCNADEIIAKVLDAVESNVTALTYRSDKVHDIFDAIEAINQLRGDDGHR